MAPISYPAGGGYQVPEFVTQALGHTPGAGVPPQGGRSAMMGTPGAYPQSDLAQMTGALSSAELGQITSQQGPQSFQDIAAANLAAQGLPQQYTANPGGSWERFPALMPHSYSDLVRAAGTYESPYAGLAGELEAFAPEDPRGVYAGLLAEQMGMLESKESAAKKQAQALAASAGLETSGAAGADIFGIGGQYAQLAGQTMVGHEKAMQDAVDKYNQDMISYQSSMDQIRERVGSDEAANSQYITDYAANKMTNTLELAGERSAGVPWEVNPEFVKDWDNLTNYLAVNGIPALEGKLMLDMLAGQWADSPYLYANMKKGKWSYKGMKGDTGSMLHAPTISWGSLLGGTDWGTSVPGTWGGDPSSGATTGTTTTSSY